MGTIKPASALGMPKQQAHCRHILGMKDGSGDQVGAANGHPKLRPQLHKGDSSPHQGAGTIPQLSLQGSPKAASISWALWHAWGQTLSTQRYLAAKEHLVTIYRVLMSNLVHMVTSDIARR